jgi:hypothetical protein
VVWAAWVTALAGLITACTNGIAWIRHGRKDDSRFAEHESQLAGLREVIADDDRK